MNTKIICMYLPQYHETEDNNKWWGQGYTEWNAVRDARPLLRGHNQPRIPLNDNYYDLSEESAQTWKWQAQLANQYGIYGFCIYHYWFAGKKELEKPVEILLRHKEIPIHYSLCWDSASWKRTWFASQYETEVLIEQDYGDEKVWKQHFDDLLPYFQDERYIQIDNRPVFHLYHASDIPCLVEMKQYWNQLARENGFDGIYFAVGDFKGREIPQVQEAADAFYDFEPNHAFYEGRKKWYVLSTVARAGIVKRLNKYFRTNILPDVRDAKGMYRLVEKMNWHSNRRKKEYLGIFPDYDDTPRRQMKGAVYKNNNVDYFRECLQFQYEESLKCGNEFLYINAWNEWGESAYLEPDTVHGYKMLEAVKAVVGD